jgi:hypothetical protein
MVDDRGTVSYLHPRCCMLEEPGAGHGLGKTEVQNSCRRRRWGHVINLRNQIFGGKTPVRFRRFPSSTPARLADGLGPIRLPLAGRRFAPGTWVPRSRSLSGLGKKKVPRRLFIVKRLLWLRQEYMPHPDMARTRGPERLYGRLNWTARCGDGRMKRGILKIDVQVCTARVQPPRYAFLTSAFSSSSFEGPSSTRRPVSIT